MLVEHPRRLAARVNDRAELVGEAGRGERELTVVLVDVELSALRARLSRRVGLEDGRGDAMHVEDAGEDETPRPAPTMVTGVAIRPLSPSDWNAVPYTSWNNVLVVSRW